MRLRNYTGLTQVLGGTIVPPDTWMKVPEQIGYQPAFDAEAKRLVELEITPEDNGIWKDNEGTHILWRSPFSQGDGYATAAEATVLALLRAGLKVRMQYSWFLEETGLDPVTIQKLKEPDYRRYQVGVCMATPGEFRKLFTPYRIGLTMYEADNPLETHPEWRHDCRHVDKIIVPSQYCQEVFSRFYRGPIEISPLGTNPIYYVAKRRVPQDTFNICTYATLTGRKAPLETLDMFIKAFPKDKYPDVRMTFKTRLGYFGWGRNQIPPIVDPRIQIINTRVDHVPDWSAEQLRDWLLTQDVFLFLSKGEGFGMPLREAMATGIPCVFSNHTGMVEAACPNNWPIRTKTEEESPLGGTWRLPDWDLAIDTLRWMYHNREKAYEMGEKAAHWYIDNYGSDKVALHLKSLIENTNPEPTRYEYLKQVNLWDATAHLPFYKQVMDLAQPLLIVGFGDGLLHLAMAKAGMKIFTIVHPRDVEQAKAFFAEKNLTVAMKVATPFQMENLDLDRWPKFQACVSQNVMNLYKHEEIPRLLQAMFRIAPQILFSVPAVYETEYRPGNLWRWEQWEDACRGYERKFKYYNDKRSLWAHIKSNRIPDGQSRGQVTDGVWRALQ